jgi:hypothetical protein
VAYTRQQQTAMKHPALLAEECAHPRYAKVGALGNVILTINTGYE